MKKYILVLLAVLGILLVNGCNDEVSIKKEDSDEIKFKQEYESLNGKTNDSKNVYKTIEILADNGIKYVNAKKVIKILESGTGVIYFGFPECPWCRNAVPVLLDAKSKTDLDTIYYFNALKIRDTKHLDEEGNVVEDKKGTEEYYKILELLGDKADIYEGLNDEIVKRLYFPTVVFVKNGEIISIHSSTVEGQKDPYDNLTKSQRKELKNIYIEGIEKVLEEDVCETKDKC